MASNTVNTIYQSHALAHRVVPAISPGKNKVIPYSGTSTLNTSMKIEETWRVLGIADRMQKEICMSNKLVWWVWLEFIFTPKRYQF